MNNFTESHGNNASTRERNFNYRTNKNANNRRYNANRQNNVNTNSGPNYNANRQNNVNTNTKYANRHNNVNTNNRTSYNANRQNNVNNYNANYTDEDNTPPSNNRNYKNNEGSVKRLNDKFSDQKNHDNDNDFLNDNFIKEQILDYVYNAITLSNYKYKLIECEYDLPLIKEKQYFVSPNYNGINGLLVFIKIKNRYMSCIIDRKTLTYELGQVDYNKVRIIPISFKFDEEIYNGTIYDGVLLYNIFDGVKHFIINDVYYLMGKNMTAEKINNKMIHISAYLKTIKNDTSLNNIVLKTNKLYELKDIQQLVNLYIPKSKYNRSIKGLAFYSIISEMKLIYLYSNGIHDKNECHIKQSVTDNKQLAINYTTNMSDISDISNISKVKFNTQTNIIFKMKTTNIADVYNLYLGYKLTEEGKKLFRCKKIGIAYIPTKECSHFCKKIFNDNNTDTLLVECSLDTDKNRWIPVKLAENKKRPDLIENILP